MFMLMYYVRFVCVQREEAASSILTPEDDKQKKNTSMRAVIPKFKNKETEGAAAYRKASYDYHVKEKAAEEWMNLELNSAGSRASNQIFTKLLADNIEDVEFDIKANDFLGYINKQSARMGTDLTHGHFDNEQKSVESRVTELVHSAHVISFATICRYCNLKTTQQLGKALVALKKVAYLVQGNWVVQSHGYPVPGSTFRDYLILQFHKTRVVDRGKLSQVVPVELEVAQKILEEIAVQLPNKGGWEFKLSYDNSFVNTFGEIVKIQNKVLETLQQRIDVDLSGHAQVLSKIDDEANEEENKEIYGLYKEAVISLFRRFLVCHVSVVKTAATRVKKKHKFNAKILRKVLVELTTALLGNRYILTKRHATMDAYRMGVANLFKSRAKIKKKDAVNAMSALFSANNNISDANLTKILNEFATFSGGYWNLQTGYHAEF